MAGCPTGSMIKKLRDTNGPVVIYLYFCLLGAAVTFLPYISNPTIPDTALDWLMIGGIVATSIVAQITMNQGFKYCKSWEGGLFMTSEVVFAAIFGILFLSEIASWRFWLGGLLIFVSAVAFNLQNTLSMRPKIEKPDR